MSSDRRYGNRGYDKRGEPIRKHRRTTSPGKVVRTSRIESSYEGTTSSAPAPGAPDVGHKDRGSVDPLSPDQQRNLGIALGTDLTGALEFESQATPVRTRSQTHQLQAKGDLRGSPKSIHETASRGVSGGGEPLPHLETIQRSFGLHDVTRVQAYVDGKAGEAVSTIGADAYATGDKVAFESSPDLHTAAHEAAHVVQQRGGVQLKGGVGQVGDTYEQHADAVADLVVQGKSAERLLSEKTGQYGPPARVGRSRSNGPASFVQLQAKKRVSDDRSQEVMVALNSSDPIAGASNYKKAYAILNKLGMEAVLDTLHSLKKQGGSWYTILTSSKADAGSRVRLTFDILEAIAVDPRLLDDKLIPSIVRRTLAMGEGYYVKQFLRRDGYPSALEIIDGIEEPERRRRAAKAAAFEKAVEQLLRRQARENARKRHPGRVELRKYPVYGLKVGAGKLLQPYARAATVIVYFIPVAGQVLGAIDALLARQVLTGNKLAGWERMLEVIPYAGRLIRSGKNGALTVIRTAQRLKKDPRELAREVVALSRAAPHVGDIKEAKRLVAAGKSPTRVQENALHETHEAVSQARAQPKAVPKHQKRALHKRRLPNKRKRIPLTGVEKFDRPAKKTPIFAAWKTKIESMGYTVVERPLGPGNPANILAGKVFEFDPKHFKYIDLLHESKHFGQIRWLAKQGVEANPMGQNLRRLAETGAYRYEFRLAERFGFSQEYREYLLEMLEFYKQTPGIVKKMERSSKFRKFALFLMRGKK